jgi:haloalkane dehalogenase
MTQLSLSRDPALGGDAGSAARVAASSPMADDAARANEWVRARRFVTLSPGDIAVVERGEGPAALFIHGYPLNGFQWRHALERLAGVRRCIAPDLLGLGATRTAPGASVSPASQVAMLAQLLDSLGVEAVDLVGSDSGGAVAQLFAVTHPHRVRTLLLTNCDAEPNSPPPTLAPILAQARAGQFAELSLSAWLEDVALARSAYGLGGLCYARPDELSQTALEMYLAPLVASPERKALADAYALALDPNPIAGIEPKLRALDIPARVVWGMQDVIFDTAMADYLGGVLPRATVRKLDEAKLFWPEEYPEILAEEALRLWNA